MIKSLNTCFDAEEMDVFMETLDEREEMLCFLNACGVATTPCVGQACGAACIGITVCLAGAHIGA